MKQMLQRTEEREKIGMVSNSPNSVKSSIEIWHTCRVMNLHSTPLVELSGVNCSAVLNFPFKKTRLSVTTSQHLTYTHWNHDHYFVCVFALRKPRTVCPRFLHQEQEKRWERERERETERLSEKIWRGRRQLLVCGPKAIFTHSFPLLLAVHNTCTCTGEKEDKRAQDYASQMGALVEHFKRSETMQVSLPFLFKIFEEGPSLSLRKCIHVWRLKANRFRGLSWRSSAFPLLVECSCFRCLYGGPAWRVASNGHFLFERLQRANRSHTCRSLQTMKLETVNYHNKRAPAQSSASDMPWRVGRKSFIRPQSRAASWNFNETDAVANRGVGKGLRW